METVRTFLAVPLPAALQRRIAGLQAELSGALRGIHWSRAETVHLTLRFFGSITTNDLEKIRVCMLSSKLRIRPFQVEVSGLGAFPNLHCPRVLWLGLTPAEPLAELYRACQDQLAGAGWAVEARAFAPHLTIGRFRERGPDLSRMPALSGQGSLGQLPVGQLVCYQSHLLRGGARHTPLFTVPLDGTIN